MSQEPCPRAKLQATIYLPLTSSGHTHPLDLSGWSLSMGSQQGKQEVTVSSVFPVPKALLLVPNNIGFLVTKGIGIGCTAWNAGNLGVEMLRDS